ncbi:MAG: DUF4292 domain-containing protein [Deltaproteobacteria bacterium]|nr:DUF4292 domain-containing protein [Deltaproteobacteria bacterium]
MNAVARPGAFGAAVGLVVLILVAGCAPARPLVPRRFTGPLPEAATLAAAVQQQRHARSGLRALARFVYEGPEQQRRARQVLAVERPQRLRLEVLSPFGSVFVLAADNGELAAYVRSESTVYRGQATPANLERFAHVHLEVSDAVELLLGTPPVRAVQDESVSFDSQAGLLRLWRRQDAGAQVIWFNEALQAVATEERAADGLVLWRARFAAFGAEHAGMPAHIDLELPAEQRRVSLELSDIEVNPALTAALFNFTTPSGVQDVQLEDIVSAERRPGAGW